VKAEVLVAAVDKVEAFGARAAGDAIEVPDAVEAGDISRAVELIECMQAGTVGGAVGKVQVVGIVAAGTSNSNMAMAKAAVIDTGIQI
jgi:hypothetical protein